MATKDKPALKDNEEDIITQMQNESGIPTTKFKEPDAEVNGSVLRFKTFRKTQEVELEDEDGNVKKYMIREMSGRVRDAYLTAMNNKMEPDEDGKPTIKNFEGLQGLLITKCLFDVASGDPVKLEFVQQLGASVQAELLKIMRKMNGLDDAAEKRAKNS